MRRKGLALSTIVAPADGSVSKFSLRELAISAFAGGFVFRLVSGINLTNGLCLE